ncbi:NAD kinase [Mucilaginibacter polytrichastri]|uniref:NAD kinase n=1 Tax=Mucilaginibacter polytrichastri TaxID=1302689 RepID=A0A1Q5ZU04_9SPHI|nr:NAD kinase [Mucilaginibacter polytrichastri]OKS85252.1 putative inorganic polyphosphate/ATP-NAD kinase [Mucilaginibacter polytrichastri]SFS41977.1 NAD+ kinase [Mucilaginibacter polytrichastri]
MRIAVYGRQFNDSVLPYAQTVFDQLKQNNADVYVHQMLHEFLTQKLPDFNFPVLNEDIPLKGYIDLFLTLGGDGTILDTVTMIRDSGIPVMGINFGRLGYLASVNKGEIEGAIQAVLKGDYTLDSRELICVKSDENIFGDGNFALNDITIHKRDDAAMITIHAYLNDEFLNTYWGDGLIISTSTGSTAYSLSCGGPIIFPQSDTVVVTPISPHNLNVRPIVFPDSSELSFDVETRSANYLISCDSRTAVIEQNMKFRISKAGFELNLVRLNNESYLKTLRNKLLWGLDARNY